MFLEKDWNQFITIFGEYIINSNIIANFIKWYLQKSNVLIRYKFNMD